VIVMTARPARTAFLPPATPISWEAEAPTGRLPVIEALPAQAGPPVSAPHRVALVTRHVAGLFAAVLAVLVLIVLLGAVLQATGAVGLPGR
jgi:hypothetical protein